MKKAELEILVVAAWFHDSWFVSRSDGHEEESQKYRLLRIAYTIFMIGLILSSVLLAIFILFASLGETK